MTQLILFILSTSGLTIILTRSKIFKPLREYVTLHNKNKIMAIIDPILSCSLCCGFWCSVIVYYLEFKNIDIQLVLYTFAGAVMSNLIISTIQYLDRK